MENKHLQDSMDMMRLMGWTVDALPTDWDVGLFGGKWYITRNGIKYKGPYWSMKEANAALDRLHLGTDDSCGEKVYTKGESTEDNCKDDDATEMGAFEELGQNHETEAMEPEEHPVLAQDDEVGEKFKTVMEEFGKGELKSSSGETVTDPKQAKAIAYSEQREANDGGEGSGVKGHQTLNEETLKELSQIKNPKLRETLQGLFENIKEKGKLKEDPFPKRTLSESLEKEKEDINKNHPELKTSKLDKEIKEAKKQESKDSDPKVVETNKLINLFGGAM